MCWLRCRVVFSFAVVLLMVFVDFVVQLGGISTRVPTLLESPGFWGYNFQVLKSPGKWVWSWKVLEI